MKAIIQTRHFPEGMEKGSIRAANEFLAGLTTDQVISVTYHTSGYGGSDDFYYPGVFVVYKDYTEGVKK